MSTSHRSKSEGSISQQLPFFLITLPRTEESREIFKLTTLCHIVISVEAYRTPSDLTQCHNCQQFGHVWANCKQPPRFFCGAGAATYTRNARRRVTLPPLQLAATASWRKVRNPIPPIIGPASTRGRKYRGGRPREHPKLQRGGCSRPTSSHQVSPSRLRSEAVQHSNNSNLRHGNLPWQILPQE
jgi:hypothetical protein